MVTNENLFLFKLEEKQEYFKGNADRKDRIGYLNFKAADRISFLNIILTKYSYATEY